MRRRIRSQRYTLEFLERRRCPTPIIPAAQVSILTTAADHPPTLPPYDPSHPPTGRPPSVPPTHPGGPSDPC